MIDNSCIASYVGIMTSDSTIALTSLLNALAVRAREQADDKLDLTPAIGLVNDLGRYVTLGSESDVRSLQAAVAAVREQLDVGDHAVNTPEKALLGKDSHGYLAGALWAINEIMTLRLQMATESDATAPGRQTRRYSIRRAVLVGFLTQSVRTPTAILEELSKRDYGDARLDEVSRVLGELLKDGLIEPAAPAAGSDRRMRYFALTDSGREVAEAEANELLAKSAALT